MSIIRLIPMKPVRVGLAMLGAAILVAAVTCEAAARHVRHIAYHRARKQVRAAQIGSVQPSNLGAMRYHGGQSAMWREVGVQTDSVQTTGSNSNGMRYYGGPKSPMWRQVN